MKTGATRGAGLSACLLLVGCGGSGAGSEPPPLPSVQFVHDFETGTGGWLTDSADYTPETAPDDVQTESRALPEPFSGLGLYLAGTNRSDDLFIYARTKVSGLTPGRAYRAGFQVEFLTTVPSGCLGVGGSPGESVWITAGTSQSEPQTVLENGEYRVNIPRGNQGSGGTAGEVLGNIANSIADCAAFEWRAKQLSSAIPAPLQINADSRGEVWIMVGMDSGFEAFSQVFLRKVLVDFQPVRN